ncbi:hypothetical protein PFUM301597_42650 [Pseudomonas fluorescens]
MVNLVNWWPQMCSIIELLIGNGGSPDAATRGYKTLFDASSFATNL